MLSPYACLSCGAKYMLTMHPSFCPACGLNHDEGDWQPQYNQLNVERYQEIQDLRRQVASLLGRKGGRSKSEAKQNAARENGKKGGKPKQYDDVAWVANDAPKDADEG